MFIVSWNVAGLKPALQRIHEDYGGSSANNTESSNAAGMKEPAGTKYKTTENNANGTSVEKQGTAGSSTSSSATATGINCPFSNYLQLHGNVDILCLQEHKIPLSQLSSRSEPHRCSTVPGYESFWSCATDKKSRGFNGVVTYAKSGLVQSANVSPLNDPDLDSQGRCIMTDHGTFVLFNVYAPNGMHPNKMKFLHALQKSMRDQRENYGKHVVLVGDMNLKIHKRDICWRHRVLNVDQLLLLLQHQQQDNNGVQYSNAPMPKWKTDVYTHWDKITTVLETIEAVPCQTTNPNTKQTFDRWRARVKLADEKYIILGTYEESAEDALFQYSFAELAYNNEGDESIDGINNADTRIICRKKNVVSIEVLSELMSKIVNVSWDVKTQREIADSDEADLNPDNPAYVWMKGLLDEDGMVDVFRHLYPDAEGRFTVWHQQKNRRYVNEGTRIDFTLVDNALLDHVDTSGNLRCGTKNHDNPFGEEAALLACTSNGLFQAPSFAGGGIAQVSKRALDSQFGPPHTGMIYTPPSYSDHIAISLLMKRSFDDVVGQLTLQSNAATRKSQPHKKQQSIASFLCVPGAKKKTAPSNSSSFASASASSSTTAAGQKRSAQQQKQEEDSKASKSNDLKSFFGGVVDKKLSSSFKNSNAKPAGSCINNNGSQGSKKQKKNSLFNHFSKK